MNGAFLDGALAKKCCTQKSDSNWEAIAPVPDGCPESNGSSLRAQDSAAQATTTARVSLENAYELNGQSGGQELGGATILGATSGGLGSKTGTGANTGSGQKGSATGDSQGALSGLGQNENPGAGSNSGAGAGSGGGGRSLGSLANFSAGAGNGLTGVETGDKMDLTPGTAAYSGGGGASSGGSGGSDGSTNPFGNLFGGAGGAGGSGGIGGTAEGIRFGRGLASSDIPPMVSIDPEDYFMRISAHSNIFKIVEIRYQKKTLGWSHDRIQELRTR